MERKHGDVPRASSFSLKHWDGSTGTYALLLPLIAKTNATK
ncbi:MAG: hypothetical protein WB217_07880 [Mesobacillus sp.]